MPSIFSYLSTQFLQTISKLHCRKLSFECTLAAEGFPAGGMCLLTIHLTTHFHKTGGNAMPKTLDQLWKLDTLKKHPHFSTTKKNRWELQDDLVFEFEKTGWNGWKPVFFWRKIYVTYQLFLSLITFLHRFSNWHFINKTEKRHTWLTSKQSSEILIFVCFILLVVTSLTSCENRFLLWNEKMIPSTAQISYLLES